MKELMKRLDVIVVLILTASIGLNVYFLNQKPKEVIRTVTEIREVEKPVIITKIITKYETKLVTTSIMVNVDASDDVKAEAYDLIIKSNLDIQTNPLTIVEDTYGKMYIPETLTGNAKLAFLKYNITINLNPKTEWQKKTIPLDVGMGLANLEPEVGICMDIPFTELDAMIGFNGINVGMKRDLTKNSKLRAGVGLDYDHNLFTFLGLRTSIF